MKLDVCLFNLALVAQRPFSTKVVINNNNLSLVYSNGKISEITKITNRIEIFSQIVDVACVLHRSVILTLDVWLGTAKRRSPQ